MENELHLQQGKDLFPQFYDYYRNKICFGNYQPGDKLPTYKALSEKYSVSLTTIKKAYQLLEQDGYIKLTNKGSFVLEQSNTVIDTITEYIDKDIQTALHFGASRHEISQAIEHIFDKYC